MSPDAKENAAAKPAVVLMGDSVLDNFYWLKQPANNLTAQLAAALPNHRVVNLAVDQMTTFDFVKRSPRTNGWAQYSSGRKQMRLPIEYKVAADGQIYSVKNLAELAPPVQTVVLSVGGNDVYLTPSVQHELLAAAVPLLASYFLWVLAIGLLCCFLLFNGLNLSFFRLTVVAVLLAAALFCSWKCNRQLEQRVAIPFAARYEAIVSQLRAAAPGVQLIGVIPYSPHHQFPLFPLVARSSRAHALVLILQRLLLPPLVTPLARGVLRIAIRQNLPVIDLSKTFDPNNERHYGTGGIEVEGPLAHWSGVEPSNQSSQFIADLVVHLINTPQQQQQQQQPLAAGAVLCWRDPSRGIIRTRRLRSESSYKFGP